MKLTPGPSLAVVAAQADVCGRLLINRKVDDMEPTSNSNTFCVLSDCRLRNTRPNPLHATTRDPVQNAVLASGAGRVS